MTAQSNDRNLLFGVLALQMDFVNRDQLVAGMQGWLSAKHKSLGQILLEHGGLSAKSHTLLEALVQEHLQKQEHDTEKSYVTVLPPGVADKSYVTVVPTAPAVDLENTPTDVGHNGPSYIPDTIPPERRGATGGARSNTAAAPSGSRFRVIRPHARGGLGEVLVALDQELQREVALKQIQDRYADDVESRTRFVQEAEITGGLEHPGIVPVYSLGQYVDGRPYYAMRFIRGDSFKDAIEHFHKADVPGHADSKRNLELRQLLNRFVAVCQAMAYAHSRGVVHRDIKPANIMLGKYGETLVVDWGLAKPVDQVDSQHLPAVVDEERLTTSSMHSATPTMMGSAVGTPQYMSPEQAAGRLDKVGAASDVYSLGATLYTLLTGQPPVTGPDLASILLKVQTGDFPRPRQIKPSIPPPLEAICLKAMAAKPEGRYPTPRFLSDDLEHWLGDEPVSAYPEPWTMRAQRWLRRHRTLATGAMTAILVAAVGLALATGLLTAAHERERSAKVEALHQKAQAEDNFKLARGAVDRYHTEVSESLLLQEPGMQPLRKKLLEAAREFYDKFVKERGDDPSVKGEFGKALYRLGLITADIDSPRDGLEYLDKAKVKFVELTPEHSEDLALCYHHLGRLFRLTNDYPKSEANYAEALKLWDNVVDKQPDFQSHRVRSQLGLGNVFQVSRQIKKARDEYRLALLAWEKLAAGDAAKPEYQREIAVARSNLAMVLTQLGDRQEAMDNLNGAATIQDKLVQDFPNLSKYQDDLARTRFLRGDLHFQGGKNLPAQGDFLAAAGLWEKLVKSQPAVLIYQTRLAEAFASLANVYSLDRQHDKAIAASVQALDVRRKLADKNPNQFSYQDDLAKGRFQLGNVYRGAKQASLAEKEYLEALRLQDKLVKSLPKVPGFQANRARTNHFLGLLRQEQKQDKDAEEAFTQAITIWDNLHIQYPEAAEFTGGLLASYRGRAEVRSALKKYPAAVQDWNQTVTLSAGPERTWFRLYRAHTLSRNGDHDKALAEARELAPSSTGSGEALFLLARVYALAAKKDTDQHADRAVALLIQAKAAGYFKTNPKVLSEEPDFRILRSRADFQKLNG